jgi:DNA uptake protein ComE-like DNA-binding protein
MRENPRVNDELVTTGPPPIELPASKMAAWEWLRLLVLKPADQKVTAAFLIFVALCFGGWYVWRATSAPGLIELDRTEPTTSKLVVNINTAEPAELMLLPEIGKTTSVKIVEERKKGLFRNAKEFGARIKGIGPKTLPKVTPYLEGWTDEP